MIVYTVPVQHFLQISCSASIHKQKECIPQAIFCPKQLALPFISASIGNCFHLWSVPRKEKKKVYLETERLFLGFKVQGEFTELAGRKMGLLNL